MVTSMFHSILLTLIVQTAEQGSVYCNHLWGSCILIKALRCHSALHVPPLVFLHHNVFTIIWIDTVQYQSSLLGQDWSSFPSFYTPVIHLPLPIVVLLCFWQLLLFYTQIYYVASQMPLSFSASKHLIASGFDLANWAKQHWNSVSHTLQL